MAATGSWRQPSILPGFGLTLGFATFFVSAIVLLPLGALVLRTASMSPADFVATVFAPRALASYRLTFGASLVAALVNAVGGFLIAWTLVRYEFPGPAAHRCADRPALRAAHRGVGHRADGGLCRRRLGRVRGWRPAACRLPTPGLASCWR
jgi:hypothetical protein